MLTFDINPVRFFGCQCVCEQEVAERWVTEGLAIGRATCPVLLCPLVDGGPSGRGAAALQAAAPDAAAVEILQAADLEAVLPQVAAAPGAQPLFFEPNIVLRETIREWREVHHRIISRNDVQLFEQIGVGVSKACPYSAQASTLGPHTHGHSQNTAPMVEGENTALTRQ